MSVSPGSGPEGRHGSDETTPVPPSMDHQAHRDGDTMDISIPPREVMGPPRPQSPEVDGQNHQSEGIAPDSIQTQPNGVSMGLSAAAAASAQQPKVVQTAFIHKLYSMLEDNSIQHLISWSSNNESFVMSPSPEFGRTLSQYFKHTNISSFIRQLNMYGFHKVSDVFHTGSPESTLWEFKHGNGNFRRGDLTALREIKRRASRQTIMHRDPFPTPAHHKPSISHPGTPAEPMMESTDVRMAHLEQSMYDMHARLLRTEEINTALSAKCHTLNESLVKAHQWNIDLTRLVSSLVPDLDHQVRREASGLERDITRQLDLIRNYEDPHESLLSGRQPYFANINLGEPGSPRTMHVDDRRPSLHAIPPRQSILRPQPPPPPPPNSLMPQRRYGSIGTAQPLPDYHRPYQQQTQIPPPMPQHPLATVTEPGPNLGRRHTSADIRVPGWPPHSHGSPLSGQSSTQWPSSPTPSGEHHVRDQLASYEFGKPRQSISSQNDTIPSLSHEQTPSTLSLDSNWSWATSSRLGGTRAMDSAPQTRRSSMASNVHSLLNPAETAEREDEDPLGEDRKRKRLI